MTSKAWRFAIFYFGKPRFHLSINQSALLLAGVFLIIATEVLAQVSLPGTDPSSRMEAAGSLLKLIDTAVFTWIARLLAGLCVLSSGWSLKEQRFGVAIVCLLAAIVIGTAPAWIKNIFSVGGGGVFSSVKVEEIHHV